MRLQAEGAVDQDQITTLTRQHELIHQNSRLSYHIRRRRAIEHPEDAVSLIVDCTKRVVPRVSRGFTNWASYDSEMQFQVVGCIAHGIGRLLHLWPDKMYPKTSVAILNIMQEIVYLIQKKNPNQHPKTLYIQMDNCTAENKNKYVLGWASSLVAQRIFQRVIINYLPVGHTHEDIDSMFSQVSHQLNAHRQCLTPEDFKKIIILATDPNKENQFHIVKYLKYGIPNIVQPISECLHDFSGILSVCIYT